MIEINGQSITLESLVQVTRELEEVHLSKESIEKINKSRNTVDDFVKNKKVRYGITTGFGSFANVVIDEKDTKQLQRNLIISHACGVGKPLTQDIVRGIMLLRVNALSKGFSGIRLSTVQVLIDMLNKGVTPVIPEKGSLGASGDLAPLSHMVLVMIGLGEAYYKGKRMTGDKAMKEAGIETIELTSKEGLALINGTQVMTSIGAHTAYDFKRLLKQADIISSITIEALNGIACPFDPRIHEQRPHLGQINTAYNLRKILEGSKRTTKQGDKRVQDAYSLRCIPQIHCASKDAFRYLEEKMLIEMNSVTDNPLIFNDTLDVISGGNFHGQPVAIAFDYLKAAIAELANVSERRIERLVNPALSNGLPAYLVNNGGLQSGFMITQYSAASIVSENKVLAHPASVDSIPSSANQEDHVSMGTTAARQAREIMLNTRYVLAIELFASLQGIDISKDNSEMSKATKKVYDYIRKSVDFVEEDRVMNIDIEKINTLLEDNKVVDMVEKITGELKI